MKIVWLCAVLAGLSSAGTAHPPGGWLASTQAGHCRHGARARRRIPPGRPAPHGFANRRHLRARHLAAEKLCGPLPPRRGAVLYESRGDARPDQTGGGGIVHEHLRPSNRRRNGCPPPYSRDDGEAAGCQRRARPQDRRAARPAASRCSSTTRRRGIRATRALWTLLKEQQPPARSARWWRTDGHRGPKEINVQPEFFGWLTDPVKNGGGALFDFGCYGANLMTWMMDNQRPLVGHRGDAAVQARRSIRVWTTRRRSSFEYPRRRGSSRRRGTGRSTARISKSTPEHGQAVASRTAFRVRTGTEEDHRVTPPRGSRRRGLDLAPAGCRARHAEGERAVVAREQHDRDGDPRGGPRIRAHACGGDARRDSLISSVGRATAADVEHGARRERAIL